MFGMLCLGVGVALALLALEATVAPCVALAWKRALLRFVVVPAAFVALLRVAAYLTVTSIVPFGSAPAAELDPALGISFFAYLFCTLIATAQLYTFRTPSVLSCGAVALWAHVHWRVHLQPTNALSDFIAPVDAAMILSALATLRCAQVEIAREAWQSAVSSSTSAVRRPFALANRHRRGKWRSSKRHTDFSH
jgi:hypothetical protein